MPPSRIVRKLRFAQVHRINRCYHSYVNPSPSTYTATEAAILSSALSHVRKHGFTNTSLALGARDVGYRDVSTNLFPDGVFEMVKYHLISQRLGLKDKIQWPHENAKDPGHQSEKTQEVEKKLRSLILERLRGNVESGILERWQEAVALMAQPTHLPMSLSELAKLADEIWFLAGDTAVDTSWYTKRANLSAIYAAAELFMTQDTSPSFTETEIFLDARLHEMTEMGAVFRDVGEWMGFSGHSVINVLRSKGLRI